MRPTLHRPDVNIHRRKHRGGQGQTLYPGSIAKTWQPILFLLLPMLITAENPRRTDAFLKHPERNTRFQSTCQIYPSHLITKSRTSRCFPLIHQGLLGHPGPHSHPMGIYPQNLHPHHLGFNADNLSLKTTITHHPLSCHPSPTPLTALDHLGVRKGCSRSLHHWTSALLEGPWGHLQETLLQKGKLVKHIFHLKWFAL